MNEPLVSVVVPIYKVEKYLNKCVDSLLKQTYRNYEVILVDDGSPDTCPQICDLYSEKYEFVHAYHKSNGGLSDARNYGTIRAKGDWIIFVDSDDFVEPSYIEDLWNLKEKYNADIAMAWVLSVDEEDKLIGKKMSFDDFCISGEEAIYEIYGKRTIIGWNANNKLYRKNVLLSTPFPDGYYEDMACLYKILVQCDKVAIGDFNQNYHYVQRDGSILKSELSDKHFHIFKVCEEFSDFIKEKMPQYSLLVPAIYAKSVIQMLGKIKISNNEDYVRLFSKYRRLFRNNIVAVLFEPKFSCKFKILYMMLCTTPKIYRLFRS